MANYSFSLFHFKVCIKRWNHFFLPPINSLETFERCIKHLFFKYFVCKILTNVCTANPWDTLSTLLRKHIFKVCFNTLYIAYHQVKCICFNETDFISKSSYPLQRDRGESQYPINNIKQCWCKMISPTRFAI